MTAYTPENWLLEQGGPAIRLRISVMQNSGNANEINNAVSELLVIDEVHSVLNLLDGFQTPNRDKKTLEHLIHYYKDTCIEQFFQLIMDLGFRAGLPTFDKKMAPVAEIFKYMYSCRMAGLSLESDYTLPLHRFFFMSGFLFPEVIEWKTD